MGGGVVAAVVIKVKRALRWPKGASGGKGRLPVDAADDVSIKSDPPASSMKPAGLSPVSADHISTRDEAVLKKLHEHYSNWRVRRRGYVNILALLGFTTLYLVVLYLQREPGTAYQITRTIDAMLPKDGNGFTRLSLPSTALLVDWANTTVGNVWTDPSCGDTICEQPIEQPGVGRFGCPQDCGWSAQVNKVQVNLWYNSTSTANYTWNICPTGACSEAPTLDNAPLPSSSCWFATPQRFLSDSGLQQTVVYMPDGSYELCLVSPLGGVKGSIKPLPTNVTDTQQQASTVAGFLSTQDTILSNGTVIRSFINLDVKPARLNATTSQISSALDGVLENSPPKFNNSLQSWGYCGSTASSCEKACRQVEAMFYSCPIGSKDVRLRTPTIDHGTIYDICMRRHVCTLFNKLISEAGTQWNPVFIRTRYRPELVIALGLNGTGPGKEDASYGKLLQGYTDVSYSNNPTILHQIPCWRDFGNNYDNTYLDLSEYCYPPPSLLVGQLNPDDLATHNFCRLVDAGDQYCDQACDNAGCFNDFLDCCVNKVPYLDPDTYCCHPILTDESKPATFSFALTGAAAAAAPAPTSSPVLFNNATAERAKYRSLGLNNRLLGGILLLQRRHSRVSCPSVRFADLLPEAQCVGAEESVEPFGADPVLLPQSQLFDPSVVATNVSRYYNASQVNDRGTPYGFFPHDGIDGQSFPVYLDINLNAAGASNMLTYLVDGYFLDADTKSLHLQAVTYNPVLKVFANLRLHFEFRAGGTIDVVTNIQSTTVQLYDSSKDWLRLVLEVIVLGGIAFLVVAQICEVVDSRVKTSNLRSYWRHYSHWIKLFSNGLLVTCAVLWLVYVNRYANDFNPQLRYEVYKPERIQQSQDFRFPPHALELNDNGSGLDQLQEMYAFMDRCSDLLAVYIFLNGINITLMLLRIIKRLDFQPRIGLLTRTLERAAQELVHFAFLALIVFIGYSVLAFLAFGSIIEEFSSVWTSAVSCFEMLLGRVEVNDKLQQLKGFQLAVGIVFFWSFIILVVFILLNFLIAIIIESFTDVIQDAKGASTVHEEFGALFKDTWRHLFHRKPYISDSQMHHFLECWAKSQQARVAAPRTKSIVNRLLSQTPQEPPLMMVGGQHITINDLRDVMWLCLTDNEKDSPNASSMVEEMVAAVMRRYNVVCKSDVNESLSTDANVVVRKRPKPKSNQHRGGSIHSDSIGLTLSHIQQSQRALEQQLAVITQQLAAVSRQDGGVGHMSGSSSRPEAGAAVDVPYVAISAAESQPVAVVAPTRTAPTA